MLNKTELAIGLKIFTVWFVVNFVLSALPVGIAYVFKFPEQSDFLVSLYAFCFSSIITSMYNIYFDFREEIKYQVGFWLAIVWLLVMLILHIVYFIKIEGEMSVLKRLQAITMNFSLIYGTTLVISVLLSFLNLKNIYKDAVEAARSKGFENSDKRVTAFKRKLEHKPKRGPQ